MNDFDDDPTRWTVHILGPDEVHHFEHADEAADCALSMVLGLRGLYPRGSEYEPMIRVVISPPTSIREDQPSQRVRGAE